MVENIRVQHLLTRTYFPLLVHKIYFIAFIFAFKVKNCYLKIFETCKCRKFIKMKCALHIARQYSKCFIQLKCILICNQQTSNFLFKKSNVFIFLIDHTGQQKDRWWDKVERNALAVSNFSLQSINKQREGCVKRYLESQLFV